MRRNAEDEVQALLGGQPLVIHDIEALSVHRAPAHRGVQMGLPCQHTSSGRLEVPWLTDGLTLPVDHTPALRGLGASLLLLPSLEDSAIVKASLKG